jgi:hypothetical protein
MDLYEDNTLVRPNALNGLPPGVPVLDYVINSQTTVSDPDPGAPTLLGTTQVTAADGTTTVALRGHELTGNVTLIK